MRALAEVVAATGARTVAGAEDADALPVPVDDAVCDRATRSGSARSRWTSCTCVGTRPARSRSPTRDPQARTHLFTGDSLFPGGIGNTKNPGQSFDSLIEDVTTRVFDVYDDDTWFYPGHGDDSTLGAERPHLQEWRERGW